MQPSVTNAKIGWLPRKVKGWVRTALNQANCRLLLINVPKRLNDDRAQIAERRPRVPCFNAVPNRESRHFRGG